jgi:MFS family permease
MSSVHNGESVDAAPTIRAALRHRDFTLLWSGQTLSAVGNQMLPLALSMLVLERGGTTTQLGIVLGVFMAAVATGTLAAAAFGDRIRRTRMMVAADAARLVAVLTLALDPRSVPTAALFVLVALAGLGEGLFQPAFAAVVPRMLPESLLQQGNSLNSFSLYLSMVVGPGVAGVLVATSGAGGALWADALTFLASLGTLLAIRERVPDAAERESGSGVRGAFRQVSDDFVEGLRAVVSRPWIAWSILMALVVMMFVTAPALVLLPVEANSRLGGSNAYGIVLVAMGAGAVLGSVIGGRIRTRRVGVVALACVATNALTVLGLALLPLPGVIVTWAIAGIGVTIFQVLWLTAIQKDVPDHVMGRVMALDWLGSQALMPLGYALTGPLVALIGQQSLLFISAALTLVVVPLPLLARGGVTFSTSEAKSSGIVGVSDPGLTAVSGERRAH